MQQNMRPITNKDLNSLFEDMQGMPNQYINHYLLSGDQRQKLVAGMVKDMRANVQAPAQAPTQTVLAQKAEAAEPGVGSLPIREDMFPEESYANGGIIAFAQGGVFPEYTTEGLGTSLGKTLRQAGESVDAYLQRLVSESGLPVGKVLADPGVAEQIKAPQVTPAESTMTGRLTVPPDTTTSTETGIRANGAAPNFGGSLGAAKKELLGGYAQAEQALSKAEAYRSPYAGQQEAGLAALQKRAETAPITEEAAKAEAAKMYEGDPQAEYKAYLEKKLTGTESEKSKAGWAAAMMAGLGIAGGKSQYALSNIAEGATKGAEYYLNKVDKIDAANEQYQKGLAEIAQAKRLEDQGEYKESRRLFKEGKTEQQAAQDTYFNAVGRMSDKDEAITTQLLTARATLGAKKGEGVASLIMDSAKLAESARQAKAQLSMYEKRMESSDRATQAKMLETMRKVGEGVDKDQNYQAQLGALQSKYKDKGGLTSPEYQREAANLKTVFIGNALQSISGSTGEIPSSTDLLAD